MTAAALRTRARVASRRAAGRNQQERQRQRRGGFGCRRHSRWCAWRSWVQLGAAGTDLPAVAKLGQAPSTSACWRRITVPLCICMISA